MKTYIIKLELHDDYLSIKDKMGWAKTGRILLVWPHSRSRLTSQLDLRLIHRHSRSLGAQLAFVTANPAIRTAAKKQSIPVYRTIDQAEKSNWRTHQLVDQVRLYQGRTRRRNPSEYRKIRSLVHPKTPIWLASPVIRLGIFSLGVIALLAIASVLIPQATIVLTPETKTQDIILTIKANPEQNEIKMSGEIPATLFPISVEGRKVITTTGAVELPDQYAKGEETFTNLTDQAITIPKDFVVRTIGNNPIRFQTTQSGTIPPGSGEMITLTVQALLAGQSGNLPAQSLVAIEDISGINISANNPNPTSGGSDQLIRSSSSSDRQKLFDTLEANLLITAKQELKNLLNEGDQLLSDTPAKILIIDQTFFPEENIPGDQLELNLRLEFQFYIASKENLYKFASQVADAKLEENQQAITSTLTINAVTTPQLLQGNIAKWQIHISRMVRNKIDGTVIAQQAIAKKPQDLSETLFQTLSLKEPPLIYIKPGWWPWMPVLPYRIIVSNS
jgi:hypothetical protein